MRFAAEQLRDDHAFVLRVVRQSGSTLMYATERLRGDSEVVLEAVRQDPKAFRYAAEKLWSDREFVKQAVVENGSVLAYAEKHLRSDREVVLTAVKLTGCALEFAADELRADRDVVLEAVKQDGMALEFAAEELKGDRGIVLEAVRSNGWALRYAKKFRCDREFQLASQMQHVAVQNGCAGGQKSCSRATLEAVRATTNRCPWHGHAKEHGYGQPGVVLQASAHVPAKARSSPQSGRGASPARACPRRHLASMMAASPSALFRASPTKRAQGAITQAKSRTILRSPF